MSQLIRKPPFSKPMVAHLNRKLSMALLGTISEWRDSDFRFSLYLPWDESYRNLRNLRKRLGSIKQQAELNLEQHEISPENREEMLAPVEKILLENEASFLPGKGLAIFSAKGFSLALPLSESPPLLMEIDVHFKLDYILHLLNYRRHFYLLCLSPNSVKLWECDEISKQEISLTGNGAAAFRGHGSIDIGHKIGHGDEKLMLKELQQFFWMVSHKVQSVIPNKNQPLVLAGVSNLLPIYRAVNKYPHLVTKEIAGNWDTDKEIADIQSRASALILQEETEESDQAIRKFKDNYASGRSAIGVTEAIAAAIYGGVTHLFLTAGKMQWGTFDKLNGKIRLRNGYVPGAVDLANLACVHTLLHGGKVYALPGKEMPKNCEIGALVND